MADSNQQALIHQQGCYLLYNPQLLVEPEAGILKSGRLLQGEASQLIESAGRGRAWFLSLAGIPAVLRAYQRGGLVSRLNKSTYMGINIHNSRAFREWRLLAWMHRQGLPVPEPIAASLCRWPMPFSPLYRAHILLRKIDNTQTLDHRLSVAEQGASIWQQVGECIAAFHLRNIYHADLNANNILLDEDNRVYLIDFDKGEVRDNETATSWKQQNLQRLKRSLLKQQGIHPAYHFSETDWQVLLKAYQAII